MEQSLLSLGFLFLVVSLVQRSEGHGYMLEPPGRSSMWRKGFSTPINWDDNGVRCDAAEKNCGVCGNRDNEAGGKYATGTIARTYTEGQTITLSVTVTVNHKGYFEFGLCPNNNIRRPVTEDCLQRYTLQLDGGRTRFQLNSGVTGEITINAKLPPGVTCSQCVLRWFWKTGNSWGTDSTTGQQCLGCGNQERFFSCADISIVPARQRMADPVLLSDQPLGDEIPSRDNITGADISKQTNRDKDIAGVKNKDINDIDGVKDNDIPMLEHGREDIPIAYEDLE